MRIEADFGRVSPERFSEDMNRLLPEMSAREAYGNIKLPQRATSGSAGYDFFAPVSLKIAPGETVTVPTGIRVKIPHEWFLMCCPRSGLGFKYRLRLDNTVGIIDSDYYFAENEGHIIIKLTNESLSEKTVTLEAGKAFAQGIFLPYGVCMEDNADKVRTGGFGSTESGN